MSGHDRLAAHELIHWWWFNYDEGHLDVLEGLLTEDCHTSSRTELGTHPYEEFIRADCHGRAAAMAWKKQHRRDSPYPLRHHAANVHVVAERGDELELDSYLFVTQVLDRRPSTLSSGLVHWTLVRTADGYRVSQQHVILDSIESAPFHQVEYVSTARRPGDSHGFAIHRPTPGPPDTRLPDRYRADASLRHGHREAETAARPDRTGRHRDGRDPGHRAGHRRGFLGRRGQGGGGQPQG